MPIWIGVIGTLLFVATLCDIVWTTLSASQTGPISLCVIRVYKFLSHRLSSYHRTIHLFGLLTFVSTIGIWYLFFWISWAMIFSTTDGAVVDAKNGAPADTLQTAYYAGIVIFTLGIGDYIAVGHAYQLLTAFASGCGFFLLSVSAAYLLSATGALMKQRQAAGIISALGTTPQSVILNAWNGKDLCDLEKFLPTIASEIVKCGQNILTYPLIFNFHSTDAMYSFALRLAVLDEAILLIDSCVPSDLRPSKLCTIGVHQAIGQYLRALEMIRITPSDVSPQVPELGELEKAGFPLLSRDECEKNLNLRSIMDRRKTLLRLVTLGGRTWENVTNSPE